MKFTIIIIIAFLSFGFSCNKEDENKRVISGTYLVSGIKIRILYPVWPPTMGEQPTIDTMKVSYTIKIEEPQNKQDSIRFYGLEMANVVYEEGPNCSTDYYCGVYARFVNDTLQFNLASPGGRYTGTGRISGDSLLLDTKYNYRPTTYNYILKGVKQ